MLHSSTAACSPVLVPSLSYCIVFLTAVFALPHSLPAVPPSRFCLPTRPNALNLRTAYKYDLSSLSLSLRCSLSLSSSHTSAYSHACIFTHSRTGTQRRRPQTQARTHINTQELGYSCNINLHWFWGVLHCSACTEMAYSHLNSHYEKIPPPLSAPKHSSNMFAGLKTPPKISLSISK